MGKPSLLSRYFIIELYTYAILSTVGIKSVNKSANNKYSKEVNIANPVSQIQKRMNEKKIKNQKFNVNCPRGK